MDTNKHLRQEGDAWYADVTEVAKHVFGDILEKAEIRVYHDLQYRDNKNEAASILLTQTIDRVKEYGCIDNNDGNRMILTFINGKKVDIWCSEYGTVGIFEDK